MGLFDDLIDSFMGMKVYNDCTKSEDMTEDEDLEAMIYLNEQIEKEKKDSK